MKNSCLITSVFIILIAFGALSSGCTESDKTGENPLVTDVAYSTQYPLAFHNAFAYQKVPDCIYTVANTGDEPVKIRLSSEYDGYSTPTITTLTAGPGETVEAEQTVIMSPDKISGINTAAKVNLHMKTEYETPSGWKTADEQTAIIDLFPMDTMVYSVEESSGNTTYLTDYLAVFVTPGSPAVKELLGQAKEYAVPAYDEGYEYYDTVRSLSGYMCPDCTDEEAAEYSDLQVKAVYNALKNDYSISYVNMESSFSIQGDVQRISIPEESLTYNSANCADGTVLFASALEALMMNPYIIAVPEHVYLAWDTDADGTNIHALETTMIGTSSFEDAMEAGMDELDSDWESLTTESPDDEYHVVDIQKARDMGILPMK